MLNLPDFRPSGAVPLDANLDNIHLEPCPCCGSPAKFNYADWSREPARERIYIECSNIKCRTQGKARRRFYRTKYGSFNVTPLRAKKCAELWNERKTAPKRVVPRRHAEGQCRVTRPKGSVLH